MPKRYKRWKFLYWLVHGFFTHLFHLEAERLNRASPMMEVSYIVGLGIDFTFAQIRHHEVNEGFMRWKN